MNQILINNDDGNNKRKNNNINYNRNSSNDVKKIITFFAIVIIIFGIAIGARYGYRIYKNSKKEEKVLEKPQLSIEHTEEEIKIIASSEVGLDKIIYAWNDGEKIEEQLNGRTSQEEKIEFPGGNNVLRVKVIDVVGQEIESTEIFSREIQNTDKIEINTDVTPSKELKITVTSELPLKYTSYKWNDEEEVKTEAENEETENMEMTIKIPRGRNSLTITAVDNEENIKTVEKKFDGRLKPEFNVYRDSGKLYMIITHDQGLKNVEFVINNNNYTYDENSQQYDAQKQETEFYFNLKEGENTVIVRATSNEDTEAEYQGKCTYTVQ